MRHRASLVWIICLLIALPTWSSDLLPVPKPTTAQQTMALNTLASQFDKTVFFQPTLDRHMLPSAVGQSNSWSSTLLSPDLIDALRSQMRMARPMNKRVKAQLNWYKRHPAYLKRTFERGRPFLYLIFERIKREGLPAEMTLLPIVESAFDPFAYSHGRASGIWQFIPGTSRRFGLKLNWWYDGRRDVLRATDAAIAYLKYLHNLFDGDWLLALAAYNSGEGNVLRAIRKNKRRGKPTDFWALDLPRETEAYVPKLIALSELVANAHHYNIALPHIPNQPLLTRVQTGGQIDLALAAQLAGISINDIYRYNPAFNRWATDPDGPHELLLPIEKAELFEKKLAMLPPGKRIQWVRYRIQNGDSLNKLAKRFHTTVDLIKKVNRIRGGIIRAGDYLMIPKATRSLDAYRLSKDARLARLRATPKAKHKLIHRVAPGESFWTISRRYKVGMRELARWNGMAPTDPLRAGTSLVIWKDSAANVTTALNANQRTRKIRYRVRRGDSLAKISQKFRVSVKQLIRWNQLHGQKYLQPGQTLTLFVDVTRQSGI
ncbi:MAG: LysM peptidoglycan-binding domain-containing protein [Gammaproteobacteria bacterium]|nr:MAG: LysM peptidoglycan-binding domain-containing protein [Gammaproteobacteria bacterium]